MKTRAFYNRTCALKVVCEIWIKKLHTHSYGYSGYFVLLALFLIPALQPVEAQLRTNITLDYWSDLGEVPIEINGRSQFREVSNRICLSADAPEKQKLILPELMSNTEEWSLRGSPKSELLPGQCTEFSIQLSPSSAGLKQANLQVNLCSVDGQGEGCQQQMKISATALDSAEFVERKVLGWLASGVYSLNSIQPNQIVTNNNQLWLWGDQKAHVLDANPIALDFKPVTLEGGGLALPAIQLCPANGYLAAQQSDGNFVPIRSLPLGWAGYSLFDCAQSTNNTVRLVPGTCTSTKNEFVRGRVEVTHDGQDGTVCNDNFGIAEVNVLCRQLGLPAGEPLNPNTGNQIDEPELSPCGGGTGLIVRDDVACEGTESKFSDCPKGSFRQPDCFHFEDAAITCGVPSRISSSKPNCHSTETYDTGESASGNCWESFPLASQTSLPDISTLSGDDISQWLQMNAHQWVVDKGDMLVLVNRTDVTHELNDLGSGIWLRGGGKVLYSLRNINSTNLLYRIDVVDNVFGTPEKIQLSLQSPSLFDLSQEKILTVLNNGTQLSLYSRIDDSNTQIPGIQSHGLPLSYYLTIAVPTAAVVVLFAVATTSLCVIKHKYCRAAQETIKKAMEQAKKVPNKGGSAGHYWFSGWFKNSGS